MDPASSSCIILVLLVDFQSFNKENILSAAAKNGTHEEINDNIFSHQPNTLSCVKLMLELSVLVVRHHHSIIAYTFLSTFLDVFSTSASLGRVSFGSITKLLYTSCINP